MSDKPTEQPGTSPAPKTPPRRRKRRLLRWFGYLFAFFFVLLFIVPILAYLWLLSSSGEAFLKKQVESATNGAIMGRLDLDRVSLSGLLHLELEGVRLYAPGDKEPVVSLQKAVLDVRLAALIGKRIDIGQLELDAPRLHMVQEDAKTTNLARAIQPRKPPKPKEPSSGELPDIAVYAPNIHIKNAAVEIVGPSPVVVEGMNLDADLRGKIEDLDIRVGFVGEAKKPVARAAKLDLVAHYGGKDAQVKSLTLVSGDSSVKLSGGGRLDATQAELRLEEIHIAAKDVNEFVPAAKLLGDVGLSGKVVVQIPDVTSTLRLALPGAGVVVLDASAKITAPDAQGKLLQYRAEVDIDHVEPQHIVSGLPPAFVKAKITAEGKGMPMEDEILVKVDAAGTRYENLPIERAKIVARVKDMGAHIDELSVRAAAVAIDASGDADAKKANLALKLDVPDLATTRTRLAKGLKLSLPEMSGAVHLIADVKGPYTNPHVDGKLDVPSLVVGANKVENLQASINLDGLQPVPKGSFKATLDHVEASGKSGDNLAINGSIDGHKALVDASGEYAEEPVKVVVRGERLAKQKGQERWAFSTLHAEALGMKFDSLETMTVTAGQGHGAVDNLRFDGGPLGKIAVDGSGGATGPIQAHVTINGLRIEQLPETILPKEMGVGGTVNVDVTATGTAKAPEVFAKLDVAKARYQKLKPIDVHSETRYDSKGVAGKLDAAFQSGSASMFYSAPVVSPKAAFEPGAPPAPISLEMSLVRVALDNFDAFMPAPMKGELQGTVSLSGTMQNPVLVTKLDLLQFEGYGVDKLDIRLDNSYEKDQLKLHVNVSRPEAVKADLTFSTALAARPLMEGQKLQWKKLPIDAKLVLSELDLKWLKTMGIKPEDLDGRIAGKIDVGGTAGAPSLNGTFQASDVVASGYRDVDALVDIRAVDDMLVTASASIGGSLLADMRLTAKASLERASEMTPAEQMSLPFTFNAKLYPTPLERLMPPKGAQAAKPPYQATVQASIEAKGTPNEPTLKFNTVVSDIRMGPDKPIGVFNTSLTYNNALTVFSSIFSSPVAGSVQAKAQIDGSMGASALKAGAEAIMQYTVHDFSVRADNLDLGIVNGMTDAVADVGGRVTLHVDPLKPAFPIAQFAKNVKAEFLMQEVKMSVLEFGSFYGMRANMVFSGDTNRFAVNEFSGRSGKGRFGVPKLRTKNPQTGADAELPGVYFEEKEPGVFGGDFAFDLDDFPLVKSYQTMAVLSLKVRTEKYDFSQTPAQAKPNQDAGAPVKDEQELSEERIARLAPIVIDLADKRFTIGQLVFREGVMDIPTAIPKSVQSLEENPDIVIVNRQKEPVARTADGSPWVTRIGNIVIPEKECKQIGSPKLCGPFVVNAPFDNKVVLSTSSDKTFSVEFNPSNASFGRNPLNVDGAIQIDGTVALLKSRFQFDRWENGDHSNVSFKGRPVADPDLHIKAHMEKDDQRVDVTLVGTAKEPKKIFDADPPMADENEVLYFLATGQRQTRPQQSDPQQAQTQLANAAIGALGASAVGYVKDTLQSFLPESARLDVLDIDPDVAGGGISRVGAGKRFLGGDLLISGQYNPTARPQYNENTYELKSNYRLDRNKYLEGLVGNAGHHEFKFFLQSDFCTATQKANGNCQQCTLDKAKKGKCFKREFSLSGEIPCKQEHLRTDRCQRKECFLRELPAEQCTCTPDEFKAGHCARYK